MPGDLTIPEQIARNKHPYYKALESADREFKKGHVDLSDLESLMSALLANQLYDFYERVSGDRTELQDVPPEELQKALEAARLEGAEDREAVLSKPTERHQGPLKWIESHPALVGLLGILLAAFLAWLTS